MIPPMVLGYWDIRGLAQPIRLLLEFCGAEYEDKLYSCGPAPDYDKTCWFSVKETLGFDFPNLPYLIDGDIKLTQTEAILRHIARKYELDGKTDQQRRRIDLILAETTDFNMPFVSLCYNPNFASLKDDYLKALPAKLERFTKFLGEMTWTAGNELTFADFVMYEVLDKHKVLDPNCLKNFPNLEGFVRRIENLDKIDKYIKSPRFIKYPLNNKMASFGG